MFKKLIKTLCILFGLLLIAAIAIPVIFKDEILKKVNTTMAEKLAAKVTFKDFDIGLLRSFPDLSISFQELQVVGVDSFATDTLLNVTDLALKANIWSVISGDKIQIKSIKLFEPKI